MRTNFQVLMLGSLSLLLAGGCAHNQPQGGGGFSEIQPKLEPTSSGSAQSVYAPAPAGAGASLTSSSDAVGTESRNAAENVRQLLLSEPKLAPWPSKITATVAKDSKGTVILSGNVPTKSVKTKLVQRVSALPGVTHVEDKLELGAPKHPGEINLKETSAK
jgi:hypothetical protein